MNDIRNTIKVGDNAHIGGYCIGITIRGERDCQITKVNRKSIYIENENTRYWFTKVASDGRFVFSNGINVATVNA